MPKKVRVNVTARVNADKIRRIERNGRQLLVVPSVTLPDDIVMNNIMYPAEEIRKSFATLNDTPAPFGHPERDGLFVSALHPEAINQYHIGAWNENVRQIKGEDGRFRVHADKMIDVKFAEQTENGQAVLEAIEKGDPIHTSTGLVGNLQAVENADYAWTIHDMEFDHDAILLNQPGAATPDDGVGMMVNEDGKKVEVEVINSMLEDAAEQEIEWGLETTLRGLERKQRVPMIELMKTALWEIFSGSQRETTATNSKETSNMDEEQFNTLSATVDALAETVEEMKTNGLTTESVADAIANAIKPLSEKIDATNQAQVGKDQAELDDLIEKIVQANVMDEDAAKELTLNSARSLAKKCEPGPAAALSGAFKTNEETASQYKLPGGDA